MCGRIAQCRAPRAFTHIPSLLLPMSAEPIVCKQNHRRDIKDLMTGKGQSPSRLAPRSRSNNGVTIQA